MDFYTHGRLYRIEPKGALKDFRHQCMNKSNLVLKHSARQLGNVLRRVRPGLASGPRGVLLNSLPKSGTHLLHPILLSLGLKDHQGFFASTPPLTMRVRSEAKACEAVQRIMPNELFSSHMFFDSAIERVLIENETPSVFIYRDPRAVFVSELNYVQRMNRWHKYHGVLGAAASEDAAFQLLLHGVPDAGFFFPRFRERVTPYVDWITSESTFSLTFESLIGNDARMVCDRLMDYLVSMDRRFVDECRVSGQVQLPMNQLNSESSHTFTGLDPDRWQYQLSDMQRSMLEDELDDLLITMGYST